MEKEQIEQLLAEYATGEIFGENKLRLNEMFLQNPLLKEEADSMAIAWEALNDETFQSTEKIDKRFYSMLQDIKAENKPVSVPAISLGSTWLKIAVASAACIVAFAAGRSSVKPEETVRYKTVYVKPPAAHQATDNVQPAEELKNPVSGQPAKIKPVGRHFSEQERQIRSIYASERIAAVLSITEKPNLSVEDIKLLELALKEDPSPGVRLAVIDAVRPLAARAEVQGVLISAINSQSDIWIQESIVDILLEQRSKESIPQLLTLLENKNTAILVQHKIKEGIETFLY